MINSLIIVVILIALVLGWISTNGSKSQYVRVIDMLFVGPIMIYAGYIGYINDDNLDLGMQFDNEQKKKRINENNKWLYLTLMFFGATTITYNMKNFIKFTTPGCK